MPALSLCQLLSICFFEGTKTVIYWVLCTLCVNLVIVQGMECLRSTLSHMHLFTSNLELGVSLNLLLNIFALLLGTFELAVCGSCLLSFVYVFYFGDGFCGVCRVWYPLGSKASSLLDFLPHARSLDYSKLLSYCYFHIIDFKVLGWILENSLSILCFSSHCFSQK